MGQINGKLNGILSANDLQDQIDALEQSKQDKLVSGDSIKTINGVSLLGSGNMELPGGILQEDLVADITVGGIVKGTKYRSGTSLEVILRELLCTTEREMLYFGVLPEIPANIDLDAEVSAGKFVLEPVPEDILEAGVSHVYTTTSALYPEGQHEVFAYPSRYGTLAKILVVAGIETNVLTAWSYRLITNSAGKEYYVYYANAKSESIDLEYSFKYTD